LGKIDALALLHKLYGTVLTTYEVASEYGLHLPEWVVIHPVSNTALQGKFNLHIDLGEASAIALASEIPHDFLIVDDQDARRFARNRGFLIKGTLGVLLDAKRAGLIPLLRPYLARIQKTNFRLSPSVVDLAIRDAGEQ